MEVFSLSNYGRGASQKVNWRRFARPVLDAQWRYSLVQVIIFSGTGFVTCRPGVTIHCSAGDTIKDNEGLDENGPEDDRVDTY